MIPRVSLRRALADPGLLGPVLAGDSWASWRTMLMAIMGEPLTPDETALFQRLTGRDQPPGERVEECAIVAGRRGGKTRAMACLAVYVGGLCDHSDTLARGERGVVPIIAPDTKQARVALDYAEGMLSASLMLSKLVVGRTPETLSLSTGIDLQVRAASFRRLRGITAVAVLADEACFWHSDESANPDTEILNAARPMLATTRGPLVVISSPYARRGEVYNLWRRHYGPTGDAAVLVAQGSSRDFNPSLPQSLVDRAMERDPAAARSEYLGLWRDDVETFVSRDAVEACVDEGVRERPPAAAPRSRYVAFVDPSGGRADSMTLAVAHLEGKVAVLDALREVRPPFSPEIVVEEFVSTLRQYGVTKVIGDRYAGEWPPEAFRRFGVTYEAAPGTRSDMYRDLLPALNSRSVLLLDDARLISQLCSLERRTARGGRDMIDHAPGAHDDIANAAAGALCAAASRASQSTASWVPYYGYSGCCPPGDAHIPENAPRVKLPDGRFVRAIVGPGQLRG